MIRGLLRKFFDKSPIEPGQIFILDSDAAYNPFVEPLRYVVKVLAVKDGWVKYCHLLSGMNNSMTEPMFRFCFKRHQLSSIAAAMSKV